MRKYTIFGKVGRDLAESLDVLIAVDQAEKDAGHPTIVGRVTQPDGACYELRITQLKAGEAAIEATANATLSKSQREAVDKARAARRGRRSASTSSGG